MAASRKARDPGQLPFMAEPAVRVARDRTAVERVSILSRVVAPDENSPVLRILLRIAQRRVRDPDLGRPSGLGDLGGGVVEIVGRKVFVPVGIVVVGVSLDAPGIDAEFDRGPAIVPRVQEDRHVVVGADDVVAVDVRSPDLFRMRIAAVDADVRSGRRG
jgi:hypothetical protein